MEIDEDGKFSLGIVLSNIRLSFVKFSAVMRAVQDIET